MDNIYNEFIHLLKKYSYVFYKNMLIRYINDPNYFEFIYLRGIFLLKNIFIFLYFNCENMNEIISISEQAYIYFIEFLIQININSINFELTLKDAIMFTYKKTILSYNKDKISSTVKSITNSDLDNNLNILCNTVYIVNNINIIKCLNKDEKRHENRDEKSDENYANALLANKICNIELLEKKILKLISNNKELLGFNQLILNIKDIMEKYIESSSDASLAKKKTNNDSIINYIIKILDDIDHNKTTTQCLVLH